MTAKKREITFTPSGTLRARRMCGLLAVGITGVLGGPQVSQAEHVIARFTADNAYAIGFGTDTEITTGYSGPVENCSDADIYDCGPPYGNGVEGYRFHDAEANSDYFYIAAWSDKQVTQGVLGYVSYWGATGHTVTGDPAWQVCPTGMDFDCGSGGPSLAQINEKIAACNSDPPVNGHWVGVSVSGGDRLVFGETNVSAAPGTPNTPAGPGNNFSQVCPVYSKGGIGTNPDMKWMWNNAGFGSPNNISSNFTDDQNVFNTNPGGPNGGGHNEFLIFRIKASEVTLRTGSIPTVSTWGMIALVLLFLTGAVIKLGRRRATTA